MSEAPLVRVLISRISVAAAHWFREALAVAGGGETGPDGFSRVWSGAGRRLGQALLEFSPEEEAALRSEGAPLVPNGWGADEAGRAILLLASMAHIPATARASTVSELYLRGEMRERQAVLKILAYLPETGGPETGGLVELSAEAVRSNILSVLEALACDNPFPAAQMPDRAWNQMIMKCLFNGVALSRIEGLEHRRNPELRRMAGDFASERRAAGRPVPADVDLVLGG